MAPQTLPDLLTLAGEVAACTLERSLRSVLEFAERRGARQAGALLFVLALSGVRAGKPRWQPASVAPEVLADVAFVRAQLDALELELASPDPSVRAAAAARMRELDPFYTVVAALP